MDDAKRPQGIASAALPVVAILLIAGYRLAPHPWNVAPVGALFALSSLYMKRGWHAWMLPFAAVLASDVLVYLRWDGTLLHADRLVDYLAFALVLLAGRACAKRTAASRLGAVLIAPVTFYLVSNFGVWLGSEHLYPHTLSGLADCYLAGVPFFRGTLVGDWLFGLLGIIAIEGLPRLYRHGVQPGTGAA